MIQLNWYKIFGESHQIPDGRTVTPTDDIQIWLHCADIWDKTYTTLAEVLADTSTLVMLMAIDNAVDYLVRSITWSGNAKVAVPTMSSDTSPEGQVIYSAQNTEDGRYAWKAFDNNAGTVWDCWQGGALTTNQYIGYKFTSSVVVNKVSIMSEDGNRVKNFKVRGSDDGNTWTNLYSGVCPDTNPTKVLQTFSFINSTAYQYYSVFVEDVYTGAVMIGAYTVEFAYEGITTSEIAMKSIGASDYAANTLLADSTWLAAIDGSAYKDYVANVTVPKMTSNTTPEGECFGQTPVSESRTWYKAFDGVTSESSMYYTATNTGNDGYIGYEFPTAEKIYGAVAVIYMNDSISYPESIKMQCSEDGVTFTDTSALVTKTVPALNTTEFVLPLNTVPAAVRYHQIIRTAGHDRFGVQSLQFYGREIGGVQTWLHSANITDKTYTTLAEVLADSTTLSALMSNHNAVDYLVTAKGWADDICADSNAMTLIGQNNYCANTLLADSTWCNAIWNSTYKMSVINAYVPVMTGYTTPSGEVIESGHRTDLPDTAGWYAFGNNMSSRGWFSQNTGSSDTYLGYVFTNDIRLVAVVISPHTSPNTSSNLYDTGYIQGSNDSFSTFDNISTIEAGTYTNLTVVTPNNYKHRAIRIFATRPGSNYNSIRQIQFYGRKDV